MDIYVTPYERGMKAAKQCLGFWNNPYSLRTDNNKDFQEWFAGWCMGMQLEARSQEFPIDTMHS